jgi:S-formylglutathione hydrolase FrmB
MTGRRALVAGLLLVALTGPAAAAGIRPCTWVELKNLNRRINGKVLDFTHNHGGDYRIWSPALCEKRDLYVYLPPCFDPGCAYPVMIYLHGFAQDEQNFLDLVELFDQAIACGQLPPMIVAAPDGSIPGRPSLRNAGSFYLNSRAGRFEDWIACDVWNFVTQNFPVRPEREAHVLGGASMGGFGAYNLGFKYRDRFRVLVGIFPPLNVRYENCHGRYFANFDPDCFGVRESLKPFGPVARYFGVIVIRQHRLSQPLFGNDREAIDKIARDNPIEMLASYDVRPGEFDMFIGYAGRDEFNVDAQVESFLYVARQRGIEPAVAYDPTGHHGTKTGKKLFPDFVRWLGPVLAPYGPIPIAPAGQAPPRP